jgi:hypothetical protein
MTWWLIALFGLIALLAIGSRLTSSARVRRRLRKTHRRLVSKASRPSVQFNVKTTRKK